MRIPLIGKCIIMALTILMAPLTQIALISILLWKLPTEKAYHTLSYVIPIGTALSLLQGLLFATFVGKVTTRRIRGMRSRIEHLKSKTPFTETPGSWFVRDELTDLEEDISQL